MTAGGVAKRGDIRHPAFLVEIRSKGRSHRHRTISFWQWRSRLDFLYRTKAVDQSYAIVSVHQRSNATRSNERPFLNRRRESPSCTPPRSAVPGYRCQEVGRFGAHMRGGDGQGDSSCLQPHDCGLSRDRKDRSLPEPIPRTGRCVSAPMAESQDRKNRLRTGVPQRVGPRCVRQAQSQVR